MSEAIDTCELPDLQNKDDDRGVHIDKVGIRKFKAPIKVKARDGESQATIGDFSIYTSLSEEVRGANMSRYIQTIMKAVDNNVFALDVMEEILQVLKEKLESTDSYLKIRFPFYIMQKAPVTDNYTPMFYDCTLEAFDKDGVVEKYLTVEVLASSLCPCSKGMSQVEPGNETDSTIPGFGAHNQRAIVRVKVHMTGFVWVEDLVKIAEDCSSCPTYGILKRSDEKFVTEHAYHNPKFVEDMGRDAALKLADLEGVDGYVVVAESEESIHQHNAVAIVRGGEHYIQ